MPKNQESTGKVVPKQSNEKVKRKPTVHSDASSATSENGEVAQSTASPVGLTNEEIASRYKKVSHVDHILLRPEMYIGSIEYHAQTMWGFEPCAVRTDIPNLLPSGEFERRVAELQLNTVALGQYSSHKRVRHGDGDLVSEDALVEEALAKEVEPEMIDGVDKRLLIDGSEPLCAFPPGSQSIQEFYVNPGLLKIVDEIIVNAADNRLVPTAKPQTYIRVTFDPKVGEVSVENDGAAIPIARHPAHNIYIPEMIFGSLLTSSHYSTDPNSIAAGRHGFGAKLTNILSERFTVECVKDNMRFIGTWKNNMKSKASVNVGGYEYDGDYTKVSFVPEYKRFSEATRKSSLPADFDIVAELGKILKRRLLDLSASIGSGLKVYFNGELITPNDFAEFVRMHLPAGAVSHQPFVQHTRCSQGDALSCDYGIILLPPPKRGQSVSEGVAALPLVNQPHHVSLVNGIVTYQGGTHLKHLQSAFDRALVLASEHLEHEERLIVDTTAIKQHATLFVNALVRQSKFDSQSKERLVSKHTFADVHVKELVRHILCLPFIRQYCMTADKMTVALESALTVMSQAKNLMRLIPKLVEPSDMRANIRRTLILTEGDSAKALALNSLSPEQRNAFGVLPLRGKILNVRAAHPRQVATNQEVLNVLATLGLSTKEKYSDGSKLRYQRLMIMTDQDSDGFHIRGLLVSLFNYYWPELMKAIPDFVSIFSTPLLKVRTPDNGCLPFYSTTEYKKWMASQDKALIDACTVKYYKGLGTSSTEEGREYFENMDDNVRFIEASDADADAALLDRVFSRDPESIRWRKQWVMEGRLSEDEELGRGALTVPQFVNQQLLQFALADNARSLPDIRDGLRVTQRKVLWALLTRKSTNSMRVSQVSGYISEVSNYHHGEGSLQRSIIALAQSYVGSNNIPLLIGEGQFGSRFSGGSDAAAPRYIFTNIAPIARKIFPAADDALLTYSDQEGVMAEPRSYAPVVPLQFVNGSSSIGTGFASRHLPHNLNSIVATVRAMLDGKSSSEAAKLMKVGVVGFRGTIEPQHDGKRFEVTGDFDLFTVGSPLDAKHLVYNGKNTSAIALKSQLLIRITEIPIGVCIEDYRLAISEKMRDYIVTIGDYSGANNVDIQIVVDSITFLKRFRHFNREMFLKYFLLKSTAYQAMVCLDDGVIRQCHQAYEPQLDAFFTHRLAVYTKRLEMNRRKMESEIEKLEGHTAFTAFVKQNGGGRVLALSEERLVEMLQKAKVPTIEGSYKPYINRSVSSLLKDNAAELEAKLVEMKKALAHSLAHETPQTLWRDDLDALEVSFNAYTEKVAREMNADSRKLRRDGTLISIDQLTSDLVHVGFTPMDGWQRARSFERVVAKTVEKKTKASAFVSETIARCEQKEQSARQALEKAQVQYEGASKDDPKELAKLKKQVVKCQLLHMVALSALQDERRKLKQIKAISKRGGAEADSALQSIIRRGKGFGGVGSSSSPSSQSSAATAAPPSTTAMLAPASMMNLFASFPVRDYVALARQRAAFDVTRRISTGARAIVRSVAHTLLK